MTAALREDATTLQADLLQSFEITKLQGTITRLQSSDQVLELRSPYDHEMLITSGSISSNRRSRWVTRAKLISLMV